jgi:RNA polymerase sigma factor (sigma-70 family)
MPTKIDRGSIQTSLTLLSRLRDMRDHSGWLHFHALYHPLLTAVARRAGLNDEDAKDVVQETIAEAAGALPSFAYDRSRGRFKGWLLTIVRRRISNFWRAKHYQFCGERVQREEAFEPAMMDVHAFEGASYDALWDEEWRAHALRVGEDYVKRTVKPVQYQAFKLHVIDGVGAGEVAHRLGLKLMEVYWAKYRVGKMMKAAVAEALAL